VTFVQEEVFKGVLVPFTGKLLEGTRQGFENMNEALKKEGGGDIAASARVAAASGKPSLGIISHCLHQKALRVHFQNEIEGRVCCPPNAGETSFERNLPQRGLTGLGAQRQSSALREGVGHTYERRS
jgi:hypothetical protein